MPAGAAPPLGVTLVVIANDGSDAVGGTFAGAPQGATLAAGAMQFVISSSGR